jgi:hypothetical protein
LPEKSIVGKRLLFTAVILGQCVLGAPPARAVGVFVQLFPLTGEIRLRNKDAAAFPFILYSIDSPSGALNSSSSVWKSISDTYDVSGNGFIDSTTNWTKLASSPMELSEGVFAGPGGSLPGMRSISLGNIWNPNAVSIPDLVVEVRDPANQLAPVTIEYALDGDYSGNNAVDSLDYSIWRPFFGSSSILLADGNLNGTIDAADYVVWRDNLGKSIPSFSTSNGLEIGRGALVVGAAVPEPASAMLLILACAGLLAGKANGAYGAIALARALLPARAAARRRARRR